MADGNKKIWLDSNGKVLVNSNNDPYYSEECCCKEDCWQRYVASCVMENGWRQWTTPVLAGISCGRSAPNGRPDQWVRTHDGAEIWRNRRVACDKDACFRPWPVSPPQFPCPCDPICEQGFTYAEYMGPEISFPIADGYFWGSNNVLLWHGVVFLPQLSYYRSKYAPSATWVTINYDRFLARGTGWTPSRFVNTDFVHTTLSAVRDELMCCAANTPACPVGEATPWMEDRYVWTKLNVSPGDELPHARGYVKRWAKGHPTEDCKTVEGQSGTRPVLVPAEEQYAGYDEGNIPSVYFLGTMPCRGSTPTRATYTYYDESTGEYETYCGLTGVTAADEEMSLILGWAYPVDRDKTYRYVVNQQDRIRYRADYTYDPDHDMHVVTWTPDGICSVRQDYVAMTGAQEVCAHMFGSQQWGSLNVSATIQQGATLHALRIPWGGVCDRDQLPTQWRTFASMSEETLPGSPLWEYKFFMLLDPSVVPGLLRWAMWKTDTKPRWGYDARAEAAIDFCPKYYILFVTEAWWACEKEDPFPLPFGAPGGEMLKQPESCMPVAYTTTLVQFDEEYPEPYFAVGTYPQGPGETWDGKRTYWLHENEEDVDENDAPSEIPVLRRMDEHKDAYGYMAIRLDIHNFPRWCDTFKCAYAVGGSEYDVPMIDFSDPAWLYHNCPFEPDLKNMFEWPGGNVMRPQTSIGPQESACYAGPRLWSEVAPIEHVGGGFADDFCSFYFSGWTHTSGPSRVVLSCDKSAVWSCDGGDGTVMDVTASWDGYKGCPDMHWALGVVATWEDHLSCLVTSGATSDWHEIDLTNAENWQLTGGPPVSCSMPVPYHEDEDCLPYGKCSWEGTIYVHDSCHLNRASLDPAYWQLPWSPNMCHTSMSLGDGVNYVGSRIMRVAPSIMPRWYPRDGWRFCQNWPPWTGDSSAMRAYFQCGQNAGACTGFEFTGTAYGAMEMVFVDECDLELVEDMEYPAGGMAAAYNNSVHTIMHRVFSMSITSTMNGSAPVSFSVPVGGCFGGGLGDTPYVFSSAERTYQLDASSTYHVDSFNTAHLPNMWDPFPMTIEHRLYSALVDAEPVSLNCIDTAAGDLTITLRGTSGCCKTCEKVGIVPCWGPGFNDPQSPLRGGCGTAYSQHFYVYHTSTFEDSHYGSIVYGPTNYYISGENAWEQNFMEIPASAYAWGYVPWEQFCGRDIASAKFFNGGQCAQEVVWDSNLGIQYTCECGQTWNAPETSVVDPIMSTQWPGPIEIQIGTYTYQWRHQGHWTCRQTLTFVSDGKTMDDWNSAHSSGEQ